MTDEKTRNQAHVDSIRDGLVEAYNGEDFNEYVLDMLEGCYNIEYRISADRETVTSVEIMVACGGPNIYIDTKDREVQLRWWGSRADACIPNEVCEAINEIMHECFFC